MAPGVGIEPTIAESKSVVLPLHYPGTKWSRMKDSNLRTPGPKPGGIAANRMRDKTWRTSRDSNPDEQFWRLSCCHYIRDTL